MRIALCCALLVASPALAADATFTAKPAATRVGDQVKIMFAMSAPTNVTIAVLHANGNGITSFGRYGNADCRGPEITLNWGSFVGCSNKAVYVCDNLNRRIVRVGLDYAAAETCAVR